MGPTHAASFILNSDGSFTYVHDGSETTRDRFTYKASDGAAESNLATVSLTIRPVNDAPVGHDDSYSVDESGTLSLPAPGVLTNDTDAEMDSLSAILVNGPAHAASFTLNADGSFTYVHDGSETSSDSFTYKPSDGADPTVFITINPINDAPVASDDDYEVDEDGTLDVSAPGVLAGDIDVDSGSVIAQLVDGPAHGSITLNPDGSFTYRPAADYFGPDAFTYRASDGDLESNLATVTITVHAVNDPPTAGDDSSTVTEDSVGNVINVLANDSTGPANESGQSLTVTSASALHGSVTINADGTLSYSPAANYNGPDTISYTIQDDGTTAGASDPRSATTSVNVTVTGERRANGQRRFQDHERKHAAYFSGQ